MSNKKFIKKLLTTASAMAVILGGSGSAMGVDNLQISTGNLNLNTGGVTNAGVLTFPLGVANTAPAGNWNAGGGVDSLLYDAARTLTFTTDVDINSIDFYGNAPGLITVNRNVTVSSITDTNGNNRAAMTFTANKIVKFKHQANNGKTRNAGNNNFAAIASGTLDGIDVVTFRVVGVGGVANYDGTGGTLQVNNTGVVGTPAITLSYLGVAVNPYSGLVDVKTDFNVTKDAINILKIGKTVIADNTTMTVTHGENNGDIDGDILFSGANAKLKLEFEMKGGNKSVDIARPLGYGSVGPVAVDLRGKIEIYANSSTNATGDFSTTGAAGTIGKSAALRLKEFVVSGNQNVTISNPVFAENVEVRTANATVNLGKVTFTKQIATVNGGVTAGTFLLKKGADVTLGNANNAFKLNAVGVTTIGEALGSATLTINHPNAASMVANNVVFAHADSKFIINTSSQPGVYAITIAGGKAIGNAGNAVGEVEILNTDGNASSANALTIQTGILGRDAANRLKKLKVVAKHATTITSNIFAKEVEVSDIGASIISGKITTVNGLDKGKIVAKGGANLTLSGANGSDLSAAGNIEIGDAGVATVSKVNFNQHISTSKEIAGNVIFKNADSEFNIKIETAAAALPNNAKNLTIAGNFSSGNNGDNFGKVTIETARNGGAGVANPTTEIKQKNNAGVITGSLGVANRKLKELKLDVHANNFLTLNVPVFAEKITSVNNAGQLTIAKDIVADTFDVNNLDPLIKLGNGVSFTGNIIDTLLGKGKIEFVNKGTITGNVGLNSIGQDKNVNSVTFQTAGGGVNDKQIITGSVYVAGADGVKINNPGTNAFIGGDIVAANGINYAAAGKLTLNSTTSSSVAPQIVDAPVGGGNNGQLIVDTAYARFSDNVTDLPNLIVKNGKKALINGKDFGNAAANVFLEGNAEFIMETTGKHIILGTSIDGANNTAGQGVFTTTGSHEIRGDIGATKAINTINIGAGTFKTITNNSNFKTEVGGGSTNPGTINFNNNNSKFEANHNATVKGNFVNNSGNPNKGIIEVTSTGGPAARTLTLDGDIGNSSASIEQIDLKHHVASKLLLSSTTSNVHANTIVGLGGTNGVLEVASDEANLYIPVLGAQLLKVKLTSGKAPATAGVLNFKPNTKITAASLEIAAVAGNTVNLEAGSEFTGRVDVGAGAKLNLAGGKVAGLVRGLAANVGQVFVKENSELTDNIGAVGKEIEKLIFDVEGKTLSMTKGGAVSIITKNAAAGDGINFNADAKLLFTTNNNHIINAKVNADSGFKGTIEAVTGSVDFRQTVGDAQKTLKLLNLKGNAVGKFTKYAEAVFIKEAKLENNGELQFNIAARNYSFGGITLTTHDKAKFVINQNSVFNKFGTEGNNYGSRDSRFAELNLGADRTVNFDDTINFYAIKTTGANAQGQFTFKGDNIFDVNASGGGAANDGKTVNSITHTGVAGKTLILPKKIVATGDLTVGAGTVELQEDFTANSGNAANGIIAAVDGQGRLKLNKATGKQLITGVVGQPSAFKEFEFAGGDVDFVTAGSVVKSAGTRTKLIFNNSEDITVNAKTSPDFAQAEFVNSNDARVHTVQLEKAGAAVDLTGSTAGNFKFEISNNTKANIRSNNYKDLQLVTSSSNATVDFVNEATIKSIGTDQLKFATVDFTNGGEVTNGLYATTVNVKQAKVATVGGVISGTRFNLENTGSKVIFSDGFNLSSAVAASTPGKGLVEFAGAGVVNREIGGSSVKLLSVKFAGQSSSKIVSLNKDIYATDILLGKNVAKIDSALTFNGKTTLDDDSNLNLTNKRLKVDGGLVVKGKVNVSTDVVFTGTTATGGNISLANNTASTFTDSGLTALNINVEDDTSVTNQSRKFTLIASEGGNELVSASNQAAFLAKIKITNNNSITEWTPSFDATTKALILTQGNIVDKILEKDFGSDLTSESKRNIGLLRDATGAGNPSKVLSALASIKDSDQGGKGSALRKELVQRLTTTTAAASQREQTIIADVTTRAISQKVQVAIDAGSIVPDQRFASNDKLGVSAGDSHSKHGIWFNPFYMSAKQKNRSDASGFDNDSFGATLGFDTKVNDDLVLGGAFTYLNSKLKHKDVKEGDKSTMNTGLVSVYALQNVTNNWFVQSVLSVGGTHVENKEKRLTGATTSEIAKGTYTSMLVSGELLAGFNKRVQNIVVTPLAGFKYTRVNDGTYTESGTSFQNLEVKRKAINKLDVVAGLRVATKSFDINGVDILPEVHGYFSYDLLNKKNNTQARLDGIASDFAVNDGKKTRTYFNVGTSLTTRYGMMEYGLGYDAHISDKYLGHQGSLKVRVNF